MSRARPTFRGDGTHFFRGAGRPPACSGRRGGAERLRSTGVGATTGRPFSVSSATAIVKAEPYLRATCGRPYKK